MSSTKFELPTYPEFWGRDALFSEDECMAIMPISTGATKNVEEYIFRAFVYAVETCSSDVHIGGHGASEKPDIVINIRTPRGIINLRYDGPGDTTVFSQKMFKVTNTAQGGSTPEIVTTRFSMVFPGRWAQSKGLVLKKGMDKYYVDVRVEYSKTFDGFAFTCRILDQQRAPALHELGLSQVMMNCLRRILAKPSGLILVTGPTGSGKTTLLNAMVGFLNDGTRSVLTIENPVEFRLHGDGPIKQIPVRGEVTFARALRSGLRHDPDLILLGEIRDGETMDIALQAAQTGHLVLSTLHSNGAAETIPRLIDMGQDSKVDAQRIADTLKFVVSQRLINKFEPITSKRAITADEKGWLSDNGLSFTDTVFDADGRQKTGKIAILEAFEVDYAIQRVVKSGSIDTDKLYQLASEQIQFETLPMAGMRSVEAGIARLSDCIEMLESNLSAGAHLSKRARLAKEFSVNHSFINDALDKFVIEQENRQDITIADVICNMKEDGL